MPETLRPVDFDRGRRHVEGVLSALLSYDPDSEAALLVEGIDGPIEVTTDNVEELRCGMELVWRETYPDLFVEKATD